MNEEKTIKLPEQFDHCLVRPEPVYVYDAEKVIEVLKKQFIKAHETGELDLYSPDQTIEESAYIYAKEDFEFNYLNNVIPRAPFYLYDLSND